jgi:hypothetical protein
VVVGPCPEAPGSDATRGPCWGPLLVLAGGHRRVIFVSTVIRTGVVPPPGRRTRMVCVRRMVRVVAITSSGACQRRCASCASCRRCFGPGAGCRPRARGRTAPGWVLLGDRPLGLLSQPASMSAGLWKLYVAGHPKTREESERSARCDPAPRGVYGAEPQWRHESRRTTTR